MGNVETFLKHTCRSMSCTIKPLSLSQQSSAVELEVLFIELAS